MTKELYQVETRSYKRYFVLATGFDEAETKAKEVMIDEEDNSILTPSGDLKTNYKGDEVYNITRIGDKLIQ